MKGIRYRRRGIFHLLVLIYAGATMLLSATTGGAAEPNWTLYQRVLSEHTYSGHREYMDANMVNYATLKKDPRWPELIASMAAFPREALNTPGERMAFYLNGYNILSIDMVLKHWPIRRLKSLGSVFRPVWTHPAGVLAGEAVTLRYLESDILRKMGDPRVHVAINCASMSCPDLRPEPYTAVDIDHQLNDQAAKFLRQENKGLFIDKNKIYLSSIFSWFAKDFETMGGAESFVRKYRPDLPHNLKFTGVLPYNWNINADLSHRERRQALAASDW